MSALEQVREIQDCRNDRAPIPTLIWVLIALAFTLVQVRQSLYNGRLAAPPTYDDITYLLDAQSRLPTFYTGGPVEAVREGFSRPPHSPWSTGLAAIAFIVFGMEEWAPAASNGLIILGVLLWLARRARCLPPPWQLLIAGFLLTWPLAGQAVVNFRPDIACGLAIAWTALYIVTRPWVAANARHHYIAGAGLGLALLVKPTFSPITVAIVFVALIAATLTDIVRGLSSPWETLRLRWRAVAGCWLRCLGCGALLAAPYYAVAYRQLYDYIYLHNFGELKKVWQLEVPASEQALYYLTGVGGRFLLDAWLYLWIVLAIVALGLALRGRDVGALVRLPTTAATFLLTYAVVSIPAHKNEFLGAVLPCLLFFSAMEMMIYCAAMGRSAATVLVRFVGKLVPVSLVIAGVALFHWPGHILPRAEVRQHRELLESIYEDVLRSGNGPARILFTQLGPYLNPPLLQYRFGLGRIREADCLDRSMTMDPVDLEGELAVATDVIVFSQDNTDAIPWLPAARIQQQVLDRLRVHPRFFLDGAYGSPSGGRVYRFAEVLGFQDVRPIMGFGPMEGPYPQWGMVYNVRWGLGPASRLEIDVPPAGRVRLILEGRSTLPEQTMTVRAAGGAVGEHHFASRDFERIDLTLELPPGNHVVELQYSQWHEPEENDGRPRAVLFRTLLVLDAERR